LSIFIGKNVPCYSANRELRVSMSELSHRMNYAYPIDTG